MNGIILLIGGNVGNRYALLQECMQNILIEIGTIRLASKVYETAAWGNEEQAPFLNQVLEVDTNLSPTQLLEACLRIERKMGRLRKKKWESRSIDIDILFYQSEIIQSQELRIPHPRISERKFVLIPLVEILPELIHPTFKKTMKVLLKECTDSLNVELYKEKS